MTYIRRDQLTSHEAEGRGGCELIETYICHMCHFKHSYTMEYVYGITSHSNSGL